VHGTPVSREGGHIILVLRRKSGEVIAINGGVIRIIVLNVEGDRVKLGIEAPPDVVIVREELLDNLAPSSLPVPEPPKP
jgi:carbon storage regulator